LGRARDASGDRTRAPIPPISRWKMLDNVRRTLSAAAAFLTLIAGWTLPFASPVIWTTFVLAAIAIPPLLPVLTGLIPHRRGISKRSHLRGVGMDLVLAVSQVGLTVTLLAHQAWLMTDAIVRTLYRVYVTRRKLLEWVTAAQAESAFSTTAVSAYRRMGGAAVLAAVAAILVPFGPPGAWPVAMPFVLFWALSPVVAHWIRLRGRVAGAQPLSED